MSGSGGWLLGARGAGAGRGGIRLVARAAGVSRDDGVAGRRRSWRRARSRWAGCGGPAAAASGRRTPIRGWCRRCWRWSSRMSGVIRCRRCGGRRSRRRTLAAELTPAGASGVGRTVGGPAARPRGSACRPTPRRSRAPASGPRRPVPVHQRPGQGITWRAGDPVISVDTKKKELVGEFGNAGPAVAARRRPGRGSTSTTSRPTADGQGDPVRDLRPGRRTPAGSTSAPTTTPPRSPSRSIRRWWNAGGRADYPQAGRLLITADAGGSNGYRTRAWKTELAALAPETGLEITVCHFPPGTSKWNKIEHRLFSHITMNWRGRPLTSHEVIVDSHRRHHHRDRAHRRRRTRHRHLPHRDQDQRRPDRTPCR